MTNEVPTYLKYANLQMAAEALFEFNSRFSAENATPGATTSYPVIDPAALTEGNNRSSRFTVTQAQQFIDEGWTIVEHKSNTSTGFSGTLFKNAHTGELVLSFRSTEFIDDAARDNQATNSLEIKEKGWAFGQIADMKNWVDGLYSSGKITADKHLTVTGYSLGGHLATAFNLIFPGDADATYTFNGAGVGTVKAGADLKSIIQTFDVQRENLSGNEIAFTDPDAQALYLELRSAYGKSSAITAEGARDAAARAKAMRTTLGPSDAAIPIYLPTERNRQLGQIQSALERIALIQAEAQRMPGIGVGDAGTSPLSVQGPAQIDALRLDYQLAVLFAADKTAPSTGLIGGANQAVLGRERVHFSLAQQGEISTDAVAQLSTIYRSGSVGADSNSWELTVAGAGELARIDLGDQCPALSERGLCDWSSVHWAPDGTLAGGVADAGFNDALIGQADNDRIEGLGGLMLIGQSASRSSVLACEEARHA